MLDTATEEIIARFAALYADLHSHHVFTNSTMLRLAAASLAAADLPADAGGRLESAAATLKETSGWSEAASGPARFVLAAMIVRRGLDAGEVWAAVERTRNEMKRHKLRGGRATISAFLLVLAAGGRAADPATLQRAHAILESWKEDHPWLTGGDDLPMAALHGNRGSEPSLVAAQVESIYQELHRLGYGRGNQLQLASHLLAVGPASGADAAQRFHQIANALDRQGLAMARGRYDEVALLALTPGDPERLASEALAVRERLRKGEGGGLAAFFSGLSGDLAFSMAVGIVLARHAGEAGNDLDAPADAATLGLAQAALEAQQAAAICAITAATSASAASH